MKAVLASVAILACSAIPALADDVPSDLLGTWAIDGACDDTGNAISIGPGTLAYGSGEAGNILYWPDDSPNGNGAIHWAEEGSVDNFEYDPTRDVLLYNGQGYGMGIPAVLYTRC